MRSLTGFIFAALAVGILLVINHVAAPLTGVEKTIVEVSGGVILAALFLVFIIFSAAAASFSPRRCDECGRPTDPRLAYSEEPNTKNPPCRDCGRPLPDSQYNA